MAKHTVTADDLKKHPEWLKDGIKVGDKVELSEEAQEAPKEKPKSAPKAKDKAKEEKPKKAPKAKKKVDKEEEAKNLVLHQVPRNTTGRKDAVSVKNGTLMLYTAKNGGIWYHKGQMYNLEPDVKEVFMKQGLVPQE